MTQVSAHSLLGAVFSSSETKIQSHAVLPFFTTHLDVQFLLIVMPDGDLFVIRDFPNDISGRTLRYSFMPMWKSHLSEVPPEDISNMLHYDPWWMLRDRTDVPEAIVSAVVGTNIANLKIHGRQLSTVYFDGYLLKVMGVRIPRLLIGSRFISRNELFGAFR